MEADKITRHKPLLVRIGLESRFDSAYKLNKAGGVGP